MLSGDMSSSDIVKQSDVSVNRKISVRVFVISYEDAEALTTVLAWLKPYAYISATRRRLTLEAFEDACGAHAAADAHGNHAVAGIAALQFAD
jgi:hypothetical protein